MITLTSSGYVTIRGTRMSVYANNQSYTDISFINDEYTIIQHINSKNNDPADISFYTQSLGANRRITVPILYELLKELTPDQVLLIKFKEASYIVGKNLLMSYNLETNEIKPLMIHIVKKEAKNIKDGKIVINPALLSIDSTFKKMLEVIIQTGVDVELTRFIEEKYYFRLNLPKFDTLSSRKSYIESMKTKVLETIDKETL